MKNKFTIEVTLNHHLSNSLNKGGGNLSALKKWLGIVMMFAMARHKPVEEKFYLGSINEVNAFCLN
jgi:hypothetical protein